MELKDIVLTGFDIKLHKHHLKPAGETPVLEPIGSGGQTRTGDDPQYIRDIIVRLNRLFGEANPLWDQVAFAQQVVWITKENSVVAAQVENNTREQALRGNLPGALQQAVVRALGSHQALATMLLKSDRQAISAFIEVIYYLPHNHQALNPDQIEPTPTKRPQK